MSEQHLRVVISADDKTAAGFQSAEGRALEALFKHAGEGLNRFNERLEMVNERLHRVSEPLRRIHRSPGELGEESGLVRLREHAEHAHESLKKIHETVRDLVPAFGRLTGVLLGGSVVGGIAELIKSTAEFGEHEYLTAKAAGLPAPMVGGLEYAGNIAGLGQDEVDKGLKYLNRQLALAAMGKAKDVEMILGRMGLVNSPGHILSAKDVLPRIADQAKRLVALGQVPLATAMMGEFFAEKHTGVRDLCLRVACTADKP